jgi:hypothetical protein
METIARPRGDLAHAIALLSSSSAAAAAAAAVGQSPYSRDHDVSRSLELTMLLPVEFFRG